MKSRPLSMLAGLRGGPTADKPEEAPSGANGNTEREPLYGPDGIVAYRLPGSEFAVRIDGSSRAETWPPPPTGKIFTNDRDCEQLLGVDDPRGESAPLGTPPRATDTAHFPPPRPPNEAARLVPASVDPTSPIANEVREMVRASAELNETSALIGMPLPPAPPCRHEALAARFAREASLGARRLRAEERRHEGTKADLARTKRVLKNLGASNFAARTKLAEYIDKAALAQAEVQHLKRALARARRNAVAVPRPPATLVQPPRQPTLADIADVLAELAPGERTVRDSRSVPTKSNCSEIPDSSRKRS